MVFHTTALLLRGLGLRWLEWARRQRQTVELKGRWDMANTRTIKCLILNGLPRFMLARRRRKAERESLKRIILQATDRFVGETMMKE